jgi:hypothetical protein
MTLTRYVTSKDKAVKGGKESKGVSLDLAELSSEDAVFEFKLNRDTLGF